MTEIIVSKKNPKGPEKLLLKIFAFVKVHIFITASLLLNAHLHLIGSSKIMRKYGNFPEYFKFLTYMKMIPQKSS